MKLMEKLNRKTLLEKVMKTRPPATSLWQKRESILLFTGTGATVLLASHMSVEDILFTIRDLADVQQVLVDQLREQCGCCDMPTQPSLCAASVSNKSCAISKSPAVAGPAFWDRKNSSLQISRIMEKPPLRFFLL